MKRWFLENFLPFWAKETVLQDNRQLRRQVRQLRQENAVLLSYIKGLEKGMRRHVGAGSARIATPRCGGGTGNPSPTGVWKSREPWCGVGDGFPIPKG